MYWCVNENLVPPADSVLRWHTLSPAASAGALAVVDNRALTLSCAQCRLPLLPVPWLDMHRAPTISSNHKGQRGTQL